MAGGKIVEQVVSYLVTSLVDNPDEVEVEVVDQGNDSVVAEVRTAKPDMGRVIGRKGRVANAIRAVTSVAGEEEGLSTDVEFLD